MKLEKRVKNRVIVSIAVRYKVFQLDNLEKDVRDKALGIKAKISDMSRNGIQVVSSDRLKAGDILEMAMRVPGKGQTRTMAKGVWSRPATQGGKRAFRSGIRFIPIRENDVRKVEEYLKAVEKP
jgi:hypothetical protein